MMEFNKLQVSEEIISNKTKVMASGSERELFKSKIYPCVVCGRGVMADSVLCTKCRNLIYDRCVRVKS